MSNTETRERLIAAAGELFLGGSFHNVSIADICDAGDVHKGTFYHYFPSKIDLLLEIVDRYTRCVSDRFKAIVESSDTPANKISRFYSVPQEKNEAWKAEYGSTSGCFVGNIILELSSTEPAVRDKVQWALAEWSRAMQPAVAEFLNAEKIKNVDPAKGAGMLMGLMQGAQVMGKATNDHTVFSSYAKLAPDVLRCASAGR